MMAQIDDVARAVLSASRQDGDAAAATAYLADLKASPTGWQLCLARLGTPVPAAEVRFFYLSVLQHVASQRYVCGAFPFLYTPLQYTQS
jgi:hypothetical protein